MLTFLEALKGALVHLEEEEGVQVDEVHEVEVELSAFNNQCACVNFPEWNYMCFTWSNWRPGDFSGYRTDRCYYCNKKMEENHECAS